MAKRQAKPMPFTVFLDRDGVFNVHPRMQVRRYDRLRWLPGAREAFARLNRPDIRTCLVTNQPGTGLGLTTRRMIDRLHGAFLQELERHGGRLDHIEICYVPAPIPSRRRKPRPGMLQDGARALGGVDMARAVMVGDKLKDAQAAHAFGIPCILVATTSPAEALQKKADRKEIRYAAIVPDLEAAVDLIRQWVEGDA